MNDEIPIKSVSWTRSCRLIPSRFPPVDLYEPIGDDKTSNALKALDALTNPRIWDEDGNRDFLRPDDRHVTQPWLVAPFAYPDPEPTPYSDGTYGVCYVAQTNEGALIEAVRRREVFLRATKLPATKLDMRLLVTPVSAKLHDLSRIQEHPDPVSTRKLCERLRNGGSHGVLLPSAYRKGEHTAVLFRPTAMTRATQATHYCFIWNGIRISGIYEYSDQSENTYDPETLITCPAKAAA